MTQNHDENQIQRGDDHWDDFRDDGSGSIERVTELVEPEIFKNVFFLQILIFEFENKVFRNILKLFEMSCKLS